LKNLRPKPPTQTRIIETEGLMSTSEKLKLKNNLPF